ncbi:MULTISPECIES: hypothetical protein [unclassified Sphingomonas]|uniref:hypothetical protein n=1 Tax=unclassified Sphingomonas TaxID=196159 RepID=UPI001F56B9EB|nr:MULTISPECIES: hypothetical protein [unclassified Sphingomonas]
MTNVVLPLALMLALAPTASVVEGPIERVELAQVTIHQRIIIRIPRVLGGHPVQQSMPTRAIRWAEKRGPKCIAAELLEGAVITGADSVDLIIADGTRLRAELEDRCPALDFYSGLYLKQTSDGLICADRDSIRSRSGSVCKIDGFKRLEAKR